MNLHKNHSYIVLQHIFGNSVDDNNSSSSVDDWKKIESKLNIINGYRNSIGLEISCDDEKSILNNDNDNTNDIDSDDSETVALNKSSNKNNKIIIPFRKIGVISATAIDSTTSSWISSSSSSKLLVHIYGKQSQHNPSGKGDEIIRFTISESIDRVQFIDLLTNLLHWDRNRKKLDEDDEEDNTDNTTDNNNKNNNNNVKGYLKTKADKAAHFAKREIEMQQQKREREKRKAKYLKDTGGLKFTAIAMANME